MLIYSKLKLYCVPRKVHLSYFCILFIFRNGKKKSHRYNLSLSNLEINGRKLFLVHNADENTPSVTVFSVKQVTTTIKNIHIFSKFKCDM